jgi:hypothetical protein
MLNSLPHTIDELRGVLDFASGEQIHLYACRFSGESLDANHGKLNAPLLYLGTRHVHLW